MKRLIDFSSRFRILKGGKISMVVSAVLAGVTISYAAPSGGVVTSGNANISQNGNTTNINQSTQKATINWNKFNIAQNETVNFNQPNASSITLNRVIGNERSVINGALNANGQVWILNSNGVLFGKNASINTAGLLATTAKLSDNDFNSGNYNFKNSSSNSVINLGTINISNEAYAVLAGKEVTNEGSIKAVKGKIHLVGADEYSINLNGNSLLNLTVKKGILDSIVKNSGSIKADAGEIYLTTNAVNELLKGVVNNTGVIEANSMGELTGKVELFAHGGEAQVGGTISATDGFVETSGKDFKILDNAIVKAGKWL
ncbi:MAG: filamentous hemagglutinin N-terminal domain-containing protein, partial [Arcobacter sp.]|uniref:two-partner secretion domain-containing protein n=1 Tax=Arcobacter sp. TaxID=1872629 RepID=UPI003C76134B